LLIPQPKSTNAKPSQRGCVLELAAAAGAHGVRVAEAVWHWADPKHAVPPIVLGCRGVPEPRSGAISMLAETMRLTAPDGRLYPGTGSVAREENMAAAELGLPDEIFGELNRAARTD
jgi:hypothetical protein